MGREFELKFRATEKKQQAILQEPGLQWSTIAMETTYYDTPGRELGRLRWTLRRRYENGRSVCTLKTPAPGGGRGEWEVECDSIMDAIPELCKLGAPGELPYFTRDGVEAVCGARFTRQAAELALEDCTLELALDSGVLTGGSREQKLCEVEVELKSGDETAAVAYAKALAAKYGLRPEKKSKYRRALDLAAEV